MRFIAILAGCALVMASGCTAPEATPAPPLTAQDAKTLWDNIVSAGQSCDTAGKAVADAAERGDAYEMYPVLQNGIEACKGASQSIDELKPPAAATGEVKEAFEDAIETCSLSPIGRQLAFEAMAKVVDGDRRPSAVADATARAEASQMGVLRCAAKFAEASEKAGFKIDDVF